MIGIKERTVKDVDFSLQRSSFRIMEYRALGKENELKIELMVVDRLLDERISFMRKGLV